MQCPSCGHSNADDLRACLRCGSDLGLRPARPAATAVQTPVPETPTLALGADGAAPDATRTASGSRATPTSGTAGGGSPAGRLAPGHRLGPRYEIAGVLGEGGMGTVYKAVDHELGRTVALKVIRPDMAARPEVLERFRREILLASKVTHRHVLRIHDLGEAGGIRFISMAYVEGSDLKSILRRDGALPAERALPLFNQIAEALQAAHDAGIAHRDLKPQNILVDGDGQAFIADFGISRSLDAGSTMTETGAVLGTVDYMSPEQARGETPDHRGDIYALGIIMYEVLTGTLPFRSDNPLSVMVKRTHEDAPAVRRVRPDIPAWLEAIVARAMERDPAARYQSAAALRRDLERRRAAVGWRRLAKTKIVAPAAALIAAAAIILLITTFRRGGAGGTVPPPTPTLPKTALAVLPFRNATGDARFDWARNGLPELLRGELGRTAALRVAGDDRVRGTLGALQAAGDDLERPATIQRVASLAGVDTVLTGSLMKVGGQFRMSATLWRAGASTATSDPPLDVSGSGEEAIFTMARELAGKVRGDLGISASAGLPGGAAAAEPALSTRSVESLRLFEEGLELRRAGNDLEAARRFEGAAGADSGFALARAELAATYQSLGEADKAVREADAAAGALRGAGPLEAARVRAIRAEVTNDLPAAEKARAEIAALLPGSADALYDLAAVQEDKGDLAAARASLERVVALDPKHASARFMLGRVRFKTGDPQGALTDFNGALGLHLESGNEEGRATALNGLGGAYRTLGKNDEALKHLHEALEIRRRIGDRRGTAATLTNIGLILAYQGKTAEAITALQEVMSIDRDIGNHKGLAEAHTYLGDIYQGVGRNEEALAAYQESLKVVKEIGDDSLLAGSLSSVGYVNMLLGRYLDAFFFMKDALDKRRALGDKLEILRSLIDIGVIEQVQGRYDEALKYDDEGLALARDTSNQAGIATLDINLANIHEDRGDFGGALALLDDAVALCRQGEDPSTLAVALSYTGSVRLRIGDFAAAAAALDESDKVAAEMGSRATAAETGIYRGELLAARGRSAEAAAAFRKAVAEARQVGDRRLFLLARLRAAEAGRSAGGLEAVRREAESAGLRPLLAPASLAAARLNSAAGRFETAARHAALAETAASSLGQRDLLFQSRHLAGSLLARQGKTSEAAARYRAALDPLTDILAGLKGDPRTRFLARPATASFRAEASLLFQNANLGDDARRLESATAP